MEVGTEKTEQIDDDLVKRKEKGAVLFRECPKLHLTTCLRKALTGNKNALSPGS
jgi:hypothetical protein